jgi:membrane-bound inhibitor of C-type lysozyme
MDLFAIVQKVSLFITVTDGMRTIALSCLSTLLLTGCMAKDKGLSYRYECDNQWVVDVQYENTEASANARLTLNDRELVLYSVMAASGAKYATENGLSEGKGLVWWTKGASGTLYENILDDSVDDPLVVLTHCAEYKS